MSKQLTNPLQALVSGAAKQLPAATGRVAVQQARIDRRKGKMVILADISFSMSSEAWGGQTKLDLLREAVASVMSRYDCQLIVFSDRAREVSAVPAEVEGGTDLAAGLQAALAHDPGITLVISDGQPQNPGESLKLARTFRGVINTLYIGPESDAAAIEYMRTLSKQADGATAVNDISAAAGVRQLEHKIAGLLT